MAVAYADNNITINCICPGGVETDTSLKNRRIMAKLSGKESNYFNDNMKIKNGLGR